jgi:hypothetical protein
MAAARRRERELQARAGASQVDDAAAARGALTAGICAPLSAEIVAPSERALGFTRTFLVSDPDGHVLEIVEP